MKKHYLPLALALLLVQGVSAQSRFDAGSQIFADHYKDFVREPGALLAEIPDLPFTLDPASRSEPTADVLIALADGYTTDDIENYGLEVKAVVGDVVVAGGTVADIIDFAESEVAALVSFSRPVKMMLNNARAASATGVDAVHAGENIAQPYKGKGVIAGIYDIGMDPNHINFMDANGNNRIKNLWMYSQNGRKTTYDTPERIATFTTDDRTKTHGTHTMGCLAGSYNGNGNWTTISITGTVTAQRNKPIPYYGMAPEAEIAAACGVNTTSNIIMACQEISEYIKSSGKPGVISLSFGSNTGPHDLDDLSTRALNNIAKEIPFFIAAGNEGDEMVTLVGDFTSATTSYKTFVVPDPSSTGSAATGTVDIWSKNSDPLTVKVVIFDTTDKSEIYSYTLNGGSSAKLATSAYAGTAGYITDPNIDKAFRNSTIICESRIGVKDPTNSIESSRANVQIKFNITKAISNGSGRYALGVIVEGKPGQHFDLVCSSGDAYGNRLAALTSNDIPGWLDGTSKMSISGLACGPDMISVGAWNTRIRWANLAGAGYGYPSNYPINGIAPYSSYGTLANGKTLPLVCAPGTGIISSISSYYVAANGLTDRDIAASADNGSRKNPYELQQGTSMATPVAAGIGALWLQANPELTPADVRYIIEHTSTKDNNVTSTTDRPEAWGVGKINALEGIKMAIKIGAGVSDVTVNPADIIITANGNLWTVVAPGASSVSTVVYDLNGRPVIESETDGDTAEISGEHLQPGIYIINVNGTLSRRVAVK